MARSVKVELILDALKATRSARDFRQETDKVSGSLADAGKSAAVAGKAIDDTGDEMSEAARAAKALDRQIEDLSGSLRKLAIAQALGGDFSKQIIEQRRQLSRVTRDRKLLGDPEEIASGFVASLTTRMGPLLAKMPLSPHMMIAVGAGAAAAAPVLSAVLAGAVTAGVAGGVVGAGLLIGAQDPLVQEAGKLAGAEFSAGFQGAANPFKEEILDALGVARAEFRSLRPELQGLFADAAPYVPMLVGALAEIAHELLPDVAEATRNARPLIEMLAKEGPQAAAAFGEALRMLSSVSSESAAVLGQLLNIIELVTISTGGSLTLLAKIAPIVQGPLMTLAGFLPDVGDGARDAAEGTDALTAELKAQAIESARSVAAMEAQKLATQEVAVAQRAVATAQNSLQTSLANLAPHMGQATQLSSNLRTAMDSLYGAAIRQVDANVAYEASWDSLTESVKGNGKSLDIHTAKGRANHDALKALLTANNELYLANIDQGMSVDVARRAHERNTEKIRKESGEIGLNDKQTDKMIRTLGRIPPRKITDLIISGMKAIADQLTNLYLAQRALAEGKTISQVRGGFQGNARLFKAAGGPIDGPGTATSDSVPIMASRGEHMWTAREVSAAGGHQAVYSMRRSVLNGYAQGGAIAPVETRQRMPFVTDVSDSFVMSRADALRRVTPATPAAGSPTLDFMVKVLRQAFPALGLISGYRPGSRTLSGSMSYHAVRRAVDYPPNWEMARWVNQNYKSRTKEFISPFQEYNIHNGRDHTYTGAVWNQHNFAGGNAHNHWAMARGGVLREPVAGYGLRSGDTYSFAERGPERVSPVGAGADSATLGREIGRQVRAAVAGLEFRMDGHQVARLVDRRLGVTADLTARGGGY